MATGEKLVRDRLDGRIPADELRIEADPDAIQRLLEAKLAEEIRELAASGFRDTGEYADVAEVLLALAARHGVTAAGIEQARQAKLAERGGFGRGLVWSGGKAADGPKDARKLGIAVPAAGEVHVYADGACSGNPGPGGWGAAIIAADGSVRDVSGGEPHSTNNRMELAAATAGLLEATAASPRRIVMHLDSTYVRDGITNWINGWKRRGWTTASGGTVKNRECWQALDAAVAAAKAEGIEVSFEWVKGHAGHAGNERADRLATAGLAAFLPTGRGR